MEKEILNLLFETLKIQVEKYKIIVSADSLTHEQRKEFDTEITQMYNVLANLSNSSTIYTLAELKGLKAQYDVKFAEFDEKVANLDLSHLLVSFDLLTQEQKDSLKGQNGLSAYDIAVNNGFDGSEPEWLESLKGQNGLNGNDGVDGQNGLSAFEIAVNNGFVGTAVEWLESLKGADGQDAESPIFDFDTLDTIQKEKISTYLFNLTQFTDLLQRLTNLESNSTGGENPVIETPDYSNITFINLYENDNLSFQFSTLNNNELLIRTYKTQMSTNFNVFKTTVRVNVEDIDKIEYKVLTATDNPTLDGNLVVTNNIPLFDLSSFTLNADTIYPTRDNNMLVEFNEMIGSSYEVTGDYTGKIEEFLYLFAVVIDGYLYLVSNESQSSSYYYSNIKLTLKNGHTSDISNPSVENAILIPQSTDNDGLVVYNSLKLLDFNLTHYDTFMSDNASLFAPPPLEEQ